MADVLLIQPPIRDFYLTKKRTVPYGLASIAGALMEAGFSVEILDCLATSKARTIPLPSEMAYLTEYYGRQDISPFALFHHFRHFGYSLEHVGNRARSSGAFLVGISSLFTAYSDEALETARTVKRSLPQCRIVLGGHHPTEMPEVVMQCGAVDYVIRGEGEVAMPALAKALRHGEGIESVPGIVMRLPDGHLRTSPPAIVDHLDKVPPPALHLLNQRHYERSAKRSSVVIASRGCPLTCTYCSLGGSSSIPYRKRRVESVLAEIEASLGDDGIGFIDFEDENISLDRVWFMELLRGITEGVGRFQPELRAMNGLLPSTLDDEVVGAMKEAGFKVLNLALGSTSPEQLKRFRRVDVRSAFDDALECAEKYGLQAVGYIIAGAPGQNPGGSVRDLLYLARRRVLSGISIYYPAPGSADFQKCKRADLLPSHLSLLRSTAFPISDTTTREESVTLMRLGRILNFAKHLVDLGIEPARLSHLPESGAVPVRDRLQLGRMLLQGFMNDGEIRGVTPNGEVFAHKVSRALCLEFIGGLRTSPIRGTL